MKPLERFYNLLELDKKDVYQLFFYGILSSNQFIITIRIKPLRTSYNQKSKCFGLY
jgi:hypothetical protein